jgi:hypothetical protein
VNESVDFYVTAFSAHFHLCNFGAERLTIEIKEAVLLASPEKKKQNRNNQKKSDRSRPDKPSASAAITSRDYAP